MRFTIPLKVTSKTSGNSREHWAMRARRVKRERMLTLHFALTCKRPRGRGPRFRDAVDPPLVVTLTRIAPRPLDSHDNLRAGLKPCVDELARLLGLDDADPRVTWAYAQERGKPKEYAVEVEIVGAVPTGGVHE